MTSKNEATFEALTRAECLPLLAGEAIGRVGVVVDGYPLVIPVNFALDGDAVVIRTEHGTVVSRAAGAKVGFEVDGTDADSRSGWSVLVRGEGRALSIDDQNELIERTRATGVTPWAPGERHLWIRIEPVEITGRRITPGQGQDWRLGYSAYM
jgi:nitroimidazol reductase NimA-like FMN-containing flavoprotein (pyridoxamine 5'-phosphate oxidase superfamily)